MNTNVRNQEPISMSGPINWMMDKRESKQILGPQVITCTPMGTSPLTHRIHSRFALGIQKVSVGVLHG